MSDAKKPWEETWRVNRREDAELGAEADVVDAGNAVVAGGLRIEHVVLRSGRWDPARNPQAIGEMNLAAAAPELYRALDDAVRLLNALRDDPDHARLSGFAYDTIETALLEYRAVLHKARGE